MVSAGADTLIDAAKRWRTEGWVLLDGLIPRASIDAAMEEVQTLETPEPSGPTRRAERVGARRFRAEQFDGTTLFPLPNAPRLNRLFVQPAVVEFARLAMQTDDLRIYQSRLWSKTGGHADYEQPLHRDGNHSLVPIRPERGYWFMEAFVYLGDVDEHNGAPRFVARSDSADAEGDLSAHEVAVSGSAGSLLAYRSDVWHRGTDIDMGRERHVIVVAFKPAGLDWVGFDAHPPLITSPDFVAFATGCTPGELALFGVPMPGHDYWTPHTVEALAEMYPGLDVSPWQDAL